MRRSGVEVVVNFLDILAVIPLIAGETVEAFLQDRVAAIPKGRRKTQALVVIANAADSVLTPAVCPEMRMLKGKIFPSRSFRAVILADGAPLPV